MDRRLAAAALAFIPGLFFCIGALTLDEETAKAVGSVVGPARYPLILGALTLALGVVVLFERPAEEEPALLGSDLIPIAALFLAVVLAALLFVPLGYFLTSLGLVAAVMWILGARQPLLIAVTSIGFVAILYLVFSSGLNVVLPDGMLSLRPLLG